MDKLDQRNKLSKLIIDSKYNSRFERILSSNQFECSSFLIDRFELIDFLIVYKENNDEMGRIVNFLAELLDKLKDVKVEVVKVSKVNFERGQIAVYTDEDMSVLYGIIA